MFQYILTLEREILWEYGEVVCAAYPLNFIDTIDITNGEINDNSALAHIVYGVGFVLGVGLVFGFGLRLYLD